MILGETVCERYVVAKGWARMLVVEFCGTGRAKAPNVRSI